MFKKAVQQGRSERDPEAYSLRYVEGASEARTQLAAFFNILPDYKRPLVEGTPTTRSSSAVA